MHKDGSEYAGRAGRPAGCRVGRPAYERRRRVGSSLLPIHRVRTPRFARPSSISMIHALPLPLPDSPSPCLSLPLSPSVSPPLSLSPSLPLSLSPSLPLSLSLSISLSLSLSRAVCSIGVRDASERRDFDEVSRI